MTSSLTSVRRAPAGTSPWHFWHATCPLHCFEDIVFPFQGDLYRFACRPRLPDAGQEVSPDVECGYLDAEVGLSDLLTASWHTVHPAGIAEVGDIRLDSVSVIG